MRRYNSGNDVENQIAVANPSQSSGFSGGTGARPKLKPIAPIASTRMSTFSFTANATAKLMLAANNKRSYLLIQNNGANTIFVGFGTTPNLNGTGAVQFPVATGITFESGVIPNNEIYVVASSDTLVTVVEGVRE